MAAGRAVAGPDTIVKEWIGRGDSKLEWQFRHEILAVDGDTAVIEGWTDYDRHGDVWKEQYSNIFVIDFADDGRARSFREWWVQRPTG